MLAMALPPHRTFNRDMELRHLPPIVQSQLNQLLDCNNDWKEIMARVRKDNTSNAELPYKYTAQDIGIIERAAMQQRRSCTEIFVSEWGTSGRRRPTLKTFFELLIDAQLFRAADYVAALLGEDAPPRPAQTPAARVDVSAALKEACGVANNVFDASNMVPNNISNPAVEDLQQQHIPLPQPVVSPDSGVIPYSYTLLEMWTNNFNPDEVVETPTGRVKRRLGTGGFGSVFLAQLPDDTYVAVKRLHMAGPIPISPVQFNNEIETISKIRHPNLLSLVGYSNDGPACCLLYEYVDGGNLQVRLANEENPLPWRERLKIAESVAKGLEHLHTALEKPFIHRDVKTANILLSSFGDVKLGDFGLVRLGPAVDASRGVMTSNIVGSSPYMAAEAFRGDISIKLDTFSYGVVLIELMTALPAFDTNREDTDLVTYFESNCEDSFGLVLDQKAGDWPTEVVDSMFQIVKDCIRDKQYRPVMAVVRSRISEIVILSAGLTFLRL